MGDIREIPLTQGKVAIVDENIYPLINSVRWYVGLSHGVYRPLKMERGSRKTEYMHHYVIGFPINGFVIDHINGDGLDNRRSNLRIVTRHQNHMNRKESRLGLKTSKYVGVFWQAKLKKWRAQIGTNGVRLSLGCFTNEEEASDAYRKAALKINQPVIEIVHVYRKRD